MTRRSIFNVFPGARFRRFQLVNRKLEHLVKPESASTHVTSFIPQPSHDSTRLRTRQYDRFLDSWIEEIGLDPTPYGTHTIRRTKDIRAVQLLLGHTKLESTVWYLDIKAECALDLSKQTESLALEIGIGCRFAA